MLPIMTMGRLLVTGGAGYLGSTILRVARNWQDMAYTCFQSPPPAHLPGHRFDLDLRDEAAISQVFDSWKPDVVVHTAAPRGRTRDYADIPLMAAAVATATKTIGARLVHLSTEAVLDGKRSPYRDDAPPCPVNPYGKAKAYAEKLVAARHPAVAIVRTSLIFGLKPLDKHTQWLVSDLAAGEQVRLYTDDVCCPIWVENLAAAVLELAGRDAPGHINIAGTQPLSRWDFGLKMLLALGIQPAENLRPGLRTECGSVHPRHLVLDVRHAQTILKTPLLTVDEALKLQTGGYPRP